MKKRILFQGDSITDGNRSKERTPLGEYDKGHGYASIVSGELGYKYPNDYEFFNRGVAGNRIADLYARIKIDLLNLKPDYLSILIGVNDVWQELKDDELLKDGISAKKYKKIYDLIIEEVKEELPNTKIMILEPFLLKSTDTEKHWDYFRSEVEKRAAESKKVAEENDLVFVPLMKHFDEAAKIAPAEHWTFEGVHPTTAGYRLIANEWLKGFEKLILK